MECLFFRTPLLSAFRSDCYISVRMFGSEHSKLTVLTGEKTKKNPMSAVPARLLANGRN